MTMTLRTNEPKRHLCHGHGGSERMERRSSDVCSTRSHLLVSVDWDLLDFSKTDDLVYFGHHHMYGGSRVSGYASSPAFVFLCLCRSITKLTFRGFFEPTGVLPLFLPWRHSFQQGQPLMMMYVLQYSCPTNTCFQINNNNGPRPVPKPTSDLKKKPR